MNTDKPIVPNEWTDLFVALADFAEACGGSFHCSDPVKAEAMARVFGTAAYLLDYREDEAIRLQISGRDFADDLVARARKPLGRYTVMPEGAALAMLHRVASESLPGGIIIIARVETVEAIVRSAPVQGVSRSLTRVAWPNGAVGRIVKPGDVEPIRGVSARFCLVAEWPSQEDWHHDIGAAVPDRRCVVKYQEITKDDIARWRREIRDAPLVQMPRYPDAENALAEAQALADGNGAPVCLEITLTAEGQAIGTQRLWVYPLATFDQWMIERDADGAERPVFIGASEVVL
jgi:hypothetical protein